MCDIEVLNIDEQTGEMTVSISAQDKDNFILYYDYSIDGGGSYSELNPWPRPEAWNQSLEDHIFTVTLPFDQPITFLARAYNGFDLYTESSQIALDAIPDPERLAQEAAEAAREAELARLAKLREEQENYQEIIIEAPVPAQEQSVLPVLGILAVILLAIIFVSFVMAKKIDLLLKGRKKR